ncbi:MAG: CopY family transcriptional regulator [Acidobacteria bacterium]|nr:MAG: CopY family transcriptional regulator [Acidobacteriota bacterium]
MRVPAFRLFGFQRPSDVVLPALGKLERAVMQAAWRRGMVSVRDVHEDFGGRIAYTTLMTTLDRLYKKNLLDRRKDGRAFIYAPRVSPEELERGIAQDVIDALLGRGDAAEPLLACIVEAVSERDRELLDELERLVKEKRRQLRRDAPLTKGEDA